MYVCVHACVCVYVAKPIAVELRCHATAFIREWTVHLWADQPLLQLLLEQFDTTPLQYRHNDHGHEGVFN